MYGRERPVQPVRTYVRQHYRYLPNGADDAGRCVPGEERVWGEEGGCVCELRGEDGGWCVLLTSMKGRAHELSLSWVDISLS